MKHHDFKAIASLSGAFDEVGNPGLMHSFEYPVLDGFALDRDRIRAHLKLVRSDIMKNYTVTYEQFNNGVKRLSCDAYEVPSWLSGYMALTWFDTVSRVAEVRKHGYRLNAVGMSRYWKSPYRNARTVSEIAEIPESFLFGGTK